MVAVLDTSIVLAIAFDEAERAAAARRLRKATALFASPLLEAEFAAACRRMNRDVDVAALAELEWLVPSGRLSAEIAQVLEAGAVRGADCWHLATALWFAPRPTDIAFLTLDKQQRDVAKALGFVT
jgi:predicted nucleic acid-binding protein